MEFWGVEVQSGQSLTVKPGQDKVLHLSQANIGDIKKENGSESICLHVNVDGKKLVLATLNTEKLPQQQFDLLFDTRFEISHSWKNGSVFLFGYMVSREEEEFPDDDYSDFDVDETLVPPTNGKLTAQPKSEKQGTLKESGSGKQKVKSPEPNKQQLKDEDEDEDTDDSDSDDDEDMVDTSGSEDDEDETDSSEDDSEDEETPKKAQPEKKRPAESSKKTPVPEKKVKLATPQKTDSKKGTEHVATPHPSKKTASKQQTPKSGGGSVSCKECNRNFGSDSALDSHSKAKHSGGK